MPSSWLKMAQIHMPTARRHWWTLAVPPCAWGRCRALASCVRSGPPKRSPGPSPIGWEIPVSSPARPVQMCPCAVACPRCVRRTIGMTPAPSRGNPGTLHDAEDQQRAPSEFTPRFAARPRVHRPMGFQSPRLAGRGSREQPDAGSLPPDLCVSEGNQWEREARWARTLGEHVA